MDKYELELLIKLVDDKKNKLSDASLSYEILLTIAIKLQEMIDNLKPKQ